MAFPVENHAKPVGHRFDHEWVDPIPYIPDRQGAACENLPEDAVAPGLMLCSETLMRDFSDSGRFRNVQIGLWQPFGEGDSPMLHITNGDSAGGTIEVAKLGGTVLSWQDVLHEGPVPAGLSLDQLRGIRAAFIADQGWGSYERVLSIMAHRDEALLGASEQDEVNLWFEHDLFDQLQLIQILSVMPEDAIHQTAIIQPERTEYLGRLSPAALRGLYKQRQLVSGAQLVIARRAWEAFRSPDPAAILAFLREDTAALPSVALALTRHGQQFPSLENGLNRTERQILEALRSQPLMMKTLYVESHEKREELVFMGDAVFVTYVQRLGNMETPLIAIEPGSGSAAKAEEGFWKSTVRITKAGRAVLKGEEDMVRLNGIDRWLGGVYLTGKEVMWRWDENYKTLRTRG